jgi:RNA polymerase sigma-70 factor (ECF subfamily)
MTDIEIIEGCKAGDRKAQKLLVKKYKTYLYSACMRYVKNKYEADDILQEAFISIFKYLEGFKGDCELKGWMYQIAKNKAINHYNIEKRESMQHGEIEDYIIKERGGHSFEGKFLASDQLNKAMRILQKAAPAQYTNFRLYYIEGMDHKEIAEDIDISEGTSKSNTARAVTKLRQILSDFNNVERQYRVSA